jgi:hypothetical protein
VSHVPEFDARFLALERRPTSDPPHPPRLYFEVKRDAGAMILAGDRPLHYLDLARAHGIDRAAVTYGDFFQAVQLQRRVGNNTSKVMLFI